MPQCSATLFFSRLRALAGLILVAAASVNALAADEPAPSSYRIQPGDVLQVSVWKEEELKAEVIVRPDGGVSFPLCGDMAAGGGTVEELREKLEQRLRK